jgi:Flp pilus assembly protein TadD
MVSRDEILAQLRDSERKLVAAQASGAKDAEIIAELRRENALLKQITTNSTKAVTATTPDRRFSLFGIKLGAQPRPPASTTIDTESAPGKLVATVSAPPAPGKTDETRVSETTPPATESNTTTPEITTLLVDARRALDEKRFNEAVDLYSQVLQKDPQNVTATTNLGMAHYQLGRLDDAETQLRKAAAAMPNDARTRAVLGIIHFRKGRIEESYTELTRAVALEPRNAEAHNYLGIVLNQKGWPAAAEMEIKRSLELNPRYADAHFNLAVLYASQKTPRFDQARYHYQAALDLGAHRDARIEGLLKLASSAQTPTVTP